ncbi:hypothetical protein T492DRAFT_842538 [Pavlovales sp. CCMP2436]|nr:hypothetical protein T492DRAFT_842538 [Pavlovales sp. CCMP2436]
MQRETAMLMVQRALRRFGARRVCTLNTLTACTRTFGRMDRYTELRVTAWVYSDGHIEIDMDASTGSLSHSCYIASITGDTKGGDIQIVYYNRGNYASLYHRRYHRLLDRHGRPRLIDIACND